MFFVDLMVGFGDEKFRAENSVEIVFRFKWKISISACQIV